MSSVEDIPMFAPPGFPFGQSAAAGLAKALEAGEEPRAAVRSTRRKAEDVLVSIEDI
jgi:pantoate kinase